VHKLAQSVLAYIRQHDLLHPGDRIGVAVSGGVDSVALLRLLIYLRPEIGLVLFVVHLNHKLRGEESDLDEQFVRELAAKHGLELFSESRDVNAYAAEKKLSLETAARQVRYEFFDARLGAGDLNKIATAHTIDDQAETVILKLARGAGTRGLAGIYPKISIQHSALNIQPNAAIVRPFLSTTHDELRAYLAEIGQSWREDSSNRDLRHMRNRVRHGILPRLEEHVNPAVRDALADAAEIARAEEEYWNQQMKLLLPDLWSMTGEAGTLNGARFRKLPPAVRRRIVRAAAESLGIGLGFRQVEDVLALEDGAHVALRDSWTASRHSGEIEFRRASAGQSETDYEYQLPIPGTVQVSEAGVVLEALLVDSVDNGRYVAEHLLDRAAMNAGLIVRPWRAGERFWPAHSKDPKKIKELLQDRHITGSDKKAWPVVACGGEVVWVRGLGVRRDFQAKKTSGVLIRELPLDRGHR
jgi:tRNA(Ile)-lysidine synthase